jgi:phosphoribosylformylglycinamidine synthase
MTTDCTPRYVFADPYEGGKQAIAEAYRNLSAVGARPLAVTNCLNFGNPQRPEIMAQFVEALRGMGEACRALDFPIVSGNVSLYNESKATGGGSAILPTPAIGGVGLLEDWETSASLAFKDVGQRILLIGADPRAMPEIGQSLWLRECCGLSAGSPPKVNLDVERRNGEFTRRLIAEGHVTAVHDVSDGGILVAVAEMALAGDIGARLLLDRFETQVDRERIRHPWSLFGETQGRYLVTEPLHQHVVEKLATDNGVGCCFIGWSGGASITLAGADNQTRWEVPLDDLRAAHEGFFPKLMGSELTPEF